MSAHAILGGSSAERWLSCNASAVLSIRNPVEDKSGQAAAEGTLAHQLLESCLLEDSHPKDWRGLTIFPDDDMSNDKDGLFIDDEVVNAVSVAVDYVWTEAEGKSFCTELKVQYAEKTLKKEIKALGGIFGTADVVIESPTELTIIDYKHGVNVAVFAEDNAQIKFYMVCAVYTRHKGNFDMNKTYKGVVIQPRSYGNADVQEVIFTADELIAFEQEMIAAIVEIYEALQNPELQNVAKFGTGDHCTFCPHLGRCPAKNKEMEELTATEFENADLDLPAAKVEEKLPPVVELTDEQRNRVLLHGDGVIKWIKAVQSQAQKDAEMGIVIPNHKLVQKVAKASWIDESAAIETLVAGGFGKEAIGNYKLKTQTELKKLCGIDTIEALLHRPISGLTLVIESDKREGVDPKKLDLPE